MVLYVKFMLPGFRPHLGIIFFNEVAQETQAMNWQPVVSVPIKGSSNLTCEPNL